MHPLLFSITQVKPVWADLNGGMNCLPDLADITMKSRQEINAESSPRRAISRDNGSQDHKWSRCRGCPQERLCDASCQLQVRIPQARAL